MRVFGEFPLCRSQQESDTWIIYEALLNPAFAHHPVTIVCGLDAREQPDSVIEGSWQTHPRGMRPLLVEGCLLVVEPRESWRLYRPELPDLHRVKAAWLAVALAIEPAQRHGARLVIEYLVHLDAEGSCRELRELLELRVFNATPLTLLRARVSESTPSGEIIERLTARR